PEDVDFSQDPLSTHPIRGKKAFDANQAFPEMLFKRQHERFKQQFPELSMIHCQRYSLFAYPLSGGFRKWGLIPAKWGEGLLKLEDKLLPWLGEIMGFRLMVVLEKV
ncbi:class I SAM-dependent methyltransferase, partial [Magnetococcales bacterium HHB-1]